MTHAIDVRVYYEDTDLAGIVYYANYLKFIERGRTEMLRAAGISQARLKDETGLVFAVVHVAVSYRAPARLDDVLRIETTLTGLGGASIAMLQRVRRDGDTLVEATVRLACVGPDGRACRLPGRLRQMLAG
jgi:acyl-CoA thioester hydrolase